MRLPRDTPDTDLPPVGRALVRSMKLAYRAEPRLLVVSFVVISASWLPDAFGALWLKFLANGVTEDDTSLIMWSVFGLAGAAAAGWLVRTVGNRIQMRFRDRVTIEIEAHVAHLQASVASIEHHERPAYLDRLQLLREQVFLLNHFYDSFFSSIGSVGRIVITVALLASIHPALILLIVFALPALYVSSWRGRVRGGAEGGAGPNSRLPPALFVPGTQGGAGEGGPRRRAQGG